jgi:hypothetical protein
VRHTLILAGPVFIGLHHSLLPVVRIMSTACPPSMLQLPFHCCVDGRTCMIYFRP